MQLFYDLKFRILEHTANTSLLLAEQIHTFFPALLFICKDIQLVQPHWKKENKNTQTLLQLLDCKRSTQGAQSNILNEIN